MRFFKMHRIFVAAFVIAAMAAAGAIAASATQSKPACPKCGSSENVIPIVYGKPGRDLIEREERGEIKLGGCCVTNFSPHHHCRACDVDFK